MGYFQRKNKAIKIKIKLQWQLNFPGKKQSTNINELAKGSIANRVLEYLTFAWI